MRKVVEQESDLAFLTLISKLFVVKLKLNAEDFFIRQRRAFLLFRLGSVRLRIEDDLGVLWRRRDRLSQRL
jgi:hypothetical protein